MARKKRIGRRPRGPILRIVFAQPNKILPITNVDGRFPRRRPPDRLVGCQHVGVPPRVGIYNSLLAGPPPFRMIRSRRDNELEIRISRARAAFFARDLSVCALPPLTLVLK